MLLPPELKGKLMLRDIEELSQSIHRLNSRYNVWISNASYLNLLCFCMVRRLRLRLGCVVGETAAGEIGGSYADMLLEELSDPGKGTSQGELEAFTQILQENGIYIQKGFVEEARLTGTIHKVLSYIEEKRGSFVPGFV